MLDKLGGVFVSSIRCCLNDSLFLIIVIFIFTEGKQRLQCWWNVVWNSRHLVQAVVHTSFVSACLSPCSYAIVWSMLSRTTKWRRLSTRDWWKWTAKYERIRRILPASWVCSSWCVAYLLGLIVTNVVVAYIVETSHSSNLFVCVSSANRDTNTCDKGNVTPHGKPLRQHSVLSQTLMLLYYWHNLCIIVPVYLQTSAGTSLYHLMRGTAWWVSVKKLP